MRRLTRRKLLIACGAMLASGMAPRALFAQDDTPKRGVRYRRSHDNGWLLTEEDLAEYAAGDAMVHSDDIVLREGTDIPGGDTRGFRAGSLEECVSACEGDEACRAFTFARSTHPSSRKKRMCWIKGQGFSAPINTPGYYVSGIRRTR